MAPKIFDQIDGHKVYTEPVDDGRTKWICTCGVGGYGKNNTGAAMRASYHIRLILKSQGKK